MINGKVCTVEDLLRLVEGKDFQVFTSEVDDKAPLSKKGVKVLQKLKDILTAVVDFQEFGGEQIIPINYANVEDFIDKVEYIVDRGY